MVRMFTLHVQVLYTDESSLWLHDPLELWRRFEAMHRLSAVWGLAEKAATGPDWYTTGGRQCKGECGMLFLGHGGLRLIGQQQWCPDQQDLPSADAPLGLPCR